jgi:aspartyl-tRNA(Asn)/glutamyl-tRNA(Gln) amidotransferase subunit A
MKGDALCAMSLSEAARAVAKREVSSRALTEACLDRIARHGEDLHCIARIDPDAAVRAADEADATLAKSGPRGLLHGVPLAHKDMFFRAGRPADCGSRIMAGHVPETTSSALARLDAAGALDIAQLHMVEFALGTTGHNEITGTPRNPWNKEYITGGSSSGSGAAVAARLVFAALGSDTGGSIRLPAACCGLVGLKPTYGRVSRAGAMPLSFTLDHIGPLTRTVEDAALMLQVLAGADPADPTTPQEPVPDYRAGLNAGVRGLRIALPETYFYDKTEPEVAALARESLAVLEKLGATIVPVRLPEEFALANAMSVMITVTEAAAYHARWLRERPDDYGRQTLGRMLPGLLYPATRYIEALNLRARILDILEEQVFSKADILHTPVWPIAVPSIAESDVAANPGFMEFLTLTGHCVRPFNYTGLPAMSVPIGRTGNGLPSAMQLIGRPFDEATLFRAAAAYERETGCTAEAPPL